MNLSKQQYISLGVAGAILYFAHKGKIKNSTLKVVAVAGATGVLLKNTPVVNQFA